jgi:hypothetical protein
VTTGAVEISEEGDDERESRLEGVWRASDASGAPPCVSSPSKLSTGVAES